MKLLTRQDSARIHVADLHGIDVSLVDSQKVEDDRLIDRRCFLIRDETSQVNLQSLTYLDQKTARAECCVWALEEGNHCLAVDSHVTFKNNGGLLRDLHSFLSHLAEDDRLDSLNYIRLSFSRKDVLLNLHLFHGSWSHKQIETRVFAWRGSLIFLVKLALFRNFRQYLILDSAEHDRWLLPFSHHLRVTL